MVCFSSAKDAFFLGVSQAHSEKKEIQVLPTGVESMTLRLLAVEARPLGSRDKHPAYS